MTSFLIGKKTDDIYEMPYLFKKKTLKQGERKKDKKYAWEDKT